MHNYLTSSNKKTALQNIYKKSGNSSTKSSNDQNIEKKLRDEKAELITKLHGGKLELLAELKILRTKQESIEKKIDDMYNILKCVFKGP